MLLTLLAGGAHAADLGVGTVTAKGGLRLRAEPNTDSAILNTAYTGETVVVLERAGESWYKVEYRLESGYMCADYLDLSTAAEAELGYGQVQVSTSLNVRSGPGTKYDKVDWLPNGAVVQITGLEDGWYHIKLDNGTTGYVSGGYVKLCKKPEEASSEEDAQGEGSLADELIAYAKSFLGTPYVYGGNGPKSFDCSGFTKYVYDHFGYTINRTASDQMSNGKKVSKEDLQPGDLVFFRNDGETKAASHVGIYIGDGQFIHASSDLRKIAINSLSEGNNPRKYVGARRILES